MGKLMNKTAWLFPGQASQKVGMGKDLFEETELGFKLFEVSNDIMKFDIKNIIFNGPEELLKKTQYTQPALFIVSVIIGKLLLKRGFIPDALAGHSLGEYSALSIAGSFDFRTGLELVKIRSESMAEAGQYKNGSMAAIVGIKDEIIIELCDNYDGEGVVTPANFNSPGQIVISGNKEAVFSIMETAKIKGARLCVELNVSGAFHSPLMQPARQKLKEAIERSVISDALFPVYANFNSKRVTKTKEIKESLIEQLEHPVLWSKSIMSMEKIGINNFYEIGPGNVLKGLNKRINRKLNTVNIGTLQELENLNV
jgi:[acyl-carrier-protein] S-malonyltransferase